MKRQERMARNRPMDAEFRDLNTYVLSIDRNHVSFTDRVESLARSRLKKAMAEAGLL